MILDLFPYQEDGAAFLSMKERAGLFDDMGVGKSAQAIRALDTIEAMRILIICPAAVREVWAGEFRKFAKIHRRVLKGRDIQDLNLWLRGKAHVLILSYEMATSWAKRLEGDLIDAIVFDECFPAGTMVETDYGLLAIEKIVEGRLPVRVWCAGANGLELRPVTRYIKTDCTRGLLRIRHAHGTLNCTPNHKLWIEGRGYEAAANVKAGDHLRVVQGPLLAEPDQTEILQQVMLGALAQPAPPRIPGEDRQDASGSQGHPTTGQFRTDEGVEFRSGLSRQTGRHIEVAERPDVAGQARRERLHHRTSTPALRSPRLAGRLHGIPHLDGAGEGAIRESAAQLQSGPGRPSTEVGDRSGRCEPQHEALAFSGCEEDRRVVCSRVDSVEVQEPRSAGRTAVYNLEVAEHHNYFADGVLVGNCHYMKNDQSIRTRAMLGHDCSGAHGLARWGAFVWMLSGTPNPNDAADIWSMMRFCGATKLTRKIFRDRYYTARTGAHSAQHTPRKEMVPELKQAIKSFSLRRTKAEAGLQLPPIWLTNVTVDGDTKEVAALMRQYPDLEKAIVDAIEKGGLSFIDAQHIATLRRLVGEAKAPAYIEMLKGEYDAGRGKTVIFGIHTAALQRIYDGLSAHGIRCVKFVGETSERDRIEAVRAFQNDPDCLGIIGNITSLGTGQTLIAAGDLDVFESSWSPAGNAQAIMRVHRVGQTKDCTARFITLANSIDVVVNEVVERKTRNIAMTGTFSPVGA